MEVDVHTYKCIVNINSYYRKHGIPFNHSWYNPTIKIIINAIDVTDVGNTIVLVGRGALLAVWC